MTTETAAVPETAVPAPAAGIKPRKPKPRKHRKPKPKPKPTVVYTKSKTYGMKGERTKVVGEKLKSRMLRVSAEFADMVTKRAKEQKKSITEVTRAMVR